MLISIRFLNHIQQKVMEFNHLDAGDGRQIAKISLTTESISFIRETAKWGHFLAIIGFIMIVFMLFGSYWVIVAGLSEANVSSKLSSVWGLLSLLSACLYIVPCIELLKFSTKTKIALRTMDSEKMTIAFGHMKSLFRFLGLFTIVVIVLYIILMIAIFLFLTSAM